MARAANRNRFVTSVLVPLAGGLSASAAALFAMSVWLAGPADRFEPEPVDQGSAAVVGTAGDPPAVTGLTAMPREPEFVGPADRDVTPAGVTPGPRPDGLMLRVPADVAEPPPPPPEAETTYRRVVVLDGGSFRAIAEGGPVVVRLAGVAAPEFTATCTDADGRSWKCGARARAELSRLILNRSVGCVILDESVAEEPVARCRVGQFDLADWLVRRGWADPADDAEPALLEAGREARSNRRGRFGPAPMGVIAG